MSTYQRWINNRMPKTHLLSKTILIIKISLPINTSLILICNQILLMLEHNLFNINKTFNFPKRNSKISIVFLKEYKFPQFNKVLLNISNYKTINNPRSNLFSHNMLILLLIKVVLECSKIITQTLLFLKINQYYLLWIKTFSTLS
jgi:hypothetical protein